MWGDTGEQTGEISSWALHWQNCWAVEGARPALQHHPAEMVVSR